MTQPDEPLTRTQRSADASDNMLRPCVYSIKLRGRDSVDNLLVAAFLTGEQQIVDSVLMAATTETFSEVVDGAGRTVGHYAA